MDDTPPIRLENILEQAPTWTFAGDETLLQWMKQISRDLENRATNTSNALDKLYYNVKSTKIALDNAANSLTALQFGNQFVESRVQDDDETLASGSDPSVNEENPSEELTTEEMLQQIMDNNLKVFRKYHEKYDIELEDSDDDESPKEKTCIYRPINPYNERPLPYIIGSKEWEENLYVGIYENQQESTSDEKSDAFSESSSASHVDDNESFESNTEWASNNSIDNDNLNANNEVESASSLRGSQPLNPETPLNINIAKTKSTIGESSSISTTSSSFDKKFLQPAKQNESLTQRSESTTSTSSKNSSKTTAKITSANRENLSQYKSQTQKFVDLFAEPLDDSESILPSVSSASNKMRACEDNPTIRRESPSVLKTQPSLFVDIFSEPPEDVISPGTSAMFFNQNTKRKTVNLFDDDDNIKINDDVLPVLTNDEQLNEQKIEEKSFVKNKPSALNTFESLFDDSDDDDEFLKAFLKKPSPKEKTKISLAKTLLFDDELCEPEINSRLPQIDSDNANDDPNTNTASKNSYSHKKTKNIFDDNEDNLLFSKRKIGETKSPIQYSTTEDISQLNKSPVPVTNLFNKPLVIENVKDSANEFNDSNKDNKTDKIKSHKIFKKINIFDDLDEEVDLFSSKLKKNEDISQQTAIRDETKQSQYKLNLAKEVDANKVSEIKTNYSTLNKESIKPKEIIGHDDDYISQKRPSEIAENEAASKSLASENNLITKDKLFERAGKEEHTQRQKELSHNKRDELAQEALAPAPENVKQKPSSSNKYDFSSVLFSDEPPDDDDDDEFFETLAKTPSIVNRIYNSIDLENDIYEPELPKVPATNTSNSQTDTTENFYTGLQLFSDIPPDDDDGNIPDVNQTKRLHSVFYDDFNETLMALNQQHEENEIPNQPIFSDEPPLMNEVPNSFNKDVTDHKVPDDKKETINVDHKTKSLDADYKKSSEFSNSRPVSKLQMPNININVQALLPGTNNILLKAKVDNLESNEINDDILPDSNIRKDFIDENNIKISKSHVTEPNRTAETQHILTNITKNRVKAPASRRPSTRRARQENYRKSLIEEQQQFDGRDEKEDGENKKTETESDKTKTIVPQEYSLQNELKNTLEVQKQNISDRVNDNFKRNNVSNVASSTSQLVDDKHQDDFQIRQDISTKDNDDNLTNMNKTFKTKKEAVSLLFSDEEDDDDDFFKHFKKSNILDSKVTKATTGCENMTEESFLEKCEGNDAYTEITKDSLGSPLMAEEISDEVQPSKVTTTQYEENQSTSITGISKLNTPVQSDKRLLKSFLDSDDDDNDLFKKGSSRIKDKTSAAKFKSFLDSETDEESYTAVLQKTTKTSTLEHSKKKVPSEMPKVSMQTTKDKLFSDSGSDSDDLFGKLSSTKTFINKTSTEPASKTQTSGQLKSSLFDSSESDSNDFLASYASFSKTKTSQSVLKKNMPKTTIQTNTSLFSDVDSDEDDLFGKAPVKAAATNVTIITNAKAASTSKSTTAAAEIPKSKTANDNPLADLL